MKKWLALSAWSVLVAVISALITTAYFHNFVLVTALPAEKTQALRELTDSQISASPAEENSIIEVLSYACGYCAARENDMVQLERQLPAGKKLIRIHLAGGNNNLARYADIFATLTTMGIEQEYRDNAYFAVLTKRLDLSDQTVRDEWLKNNGIDPRLYQQASTAPETQALLDYMQAVSQYYDIKATPMFIVNKKWIVIQDRPAPEFREYLLSLLNRTPS